MHTRVKFLFVISGLIFLLFLSYFVFRNSRENKLINQGNNLVSKIELFKQQNGSIPNSLSDLGIVETEEDPLYYEKKGDNYIIWFGTSSGESKTYHSDSKKWENYDR